MKTYYKFQPYKRLILLCLLRTAIKMIVFSPPFLNSLFTRQRKSSWVQLNNTTLAVESFRLEKYALFHILNLIVVCKLFWCLMLDSDKRLWCWYVDVSSTMDTDEERFSASSKITTVFSFSVWYVLGLYTQTPIPQSHPLRYLYHTRIMSYLLKFVNEL